MAHKDRLIWIDLEMTGLRPDQDSIIEIATVVTDHDLNVIADGPELALHQNETVLAQMDDWNQRQHGNSGLLQRVRASRVSAVEAEQQTLAFLGAHLDAGISPMCGNSICQDRRFLARWMPALEAYFHYRNIDVSTLKELAARWHPHLSAGLVKRAAHLARADIYESIAELRYYRERLLIRSA